MTIWPSILVYGSLILSIVTVGVGIAYLVKRQSRSKAQEDVGDDAPKPVPGPGSSPDFLSS